MRKPIKDKVLIVAIIFYCAEVALKFFPIDFPNLGTIKIICEFIYLFGMAIAAMKTEEPTLKVYRTLLGSFAILLM